MKSHWLYGVHFGRKKTQMMYHTHSKIRNKIIIIIKCNVTSYGIRFGVTIYCKINKDKCFVKVPLCLIFLILFCFYWLLATSRNDRASDLASALVYVFIVAVMLKKWYVIFFVGHVCAVNVLADNAGSNLKAAFGVWQDDVDVQQMWW